MLLLAAATRPDEIEAATVHHGLRPESGAEATMVAGICARLPVQHSSLQVRWLTRPASNVQAAAREQRYNLLGRWAGERGLAAIATAHHADDQAETLLMRLARGAGVAGLGGVRPVRALPGGINLVRPLLGWRRADLHRIVRSAQLDSIQDPTNSDHRFDRTAARTLLTSVDWLNADRLAASASHCRDADAALAWAASREWQARVERQGEFLMLRTDQLPRELKRRLLAAAVLELGRAEPNGPDLLSALLRLEAGEITTLAGLKLEGGPVWRLSIAPPRNVTS